MKSYRVPVVLFIVRYKVVVTFSLQVYLIDDINDINDIIE